MLLKTFRTVAKVVTTQITGLPTEAEDHLIMPLCPMAERGSATAATKPNSNRPRIMSRTIIRSPAKAATTRFRGRPSAER